MILSRLELWVTYSAREREYSCSRVEVWEYHD